MKLFNRKWRVKFQLIINILRGKYTYITKTNIKHINYIIIKHNLFPLEYKVELDFSNHYLSRFNEEERKAFINRSLNQKLIEHIQDCKLLELEYYQNDFEESIRVIGKIKIIIDTNKK